MKRDYQNSLIIGLALTLGVVIGDRRDESLDSGYFGFVAGNLIVALVRRVNFSRDDSRGVIRWSRIGHLVR